MVETDLSDLVRLLRFSGYYWNFEGNPREPVLAKLQFLRLLVIITVNPFSVASIFMGGIKNTMGLESFSGINAFVIAIVHSYFYVQREKTAGIIQYIRHFRAKYQEHSDEEFQENTRLIWKIVHMYFYNMTGLAVVYIFSPKLADLVYGVIWNDPIAHRVPLSLDSFLDKEQERDLRYFIVSFASVIWCVLCTYSHFGIDSFLCLIGFYYSSVVKTFCSRLHIDSDLRSPQTTARIKYIAAQHRDLHILSLKIRELFGFPFALQNLCGAFCIVSLVYSMMTDDSGGLPIMCANIFTLFLMTVKLTSTAFVGQHVTDESSTIFHAVYNMPWYELRPTDRKYFITMLCAARDPIIIHYHGCAPLNYTTFMAILNTAYSYVMFMKSVM